MTGLILDIVVVVIAVLLLIFGIWRGMYKLIFGLVSALLALVLAIILVSPVSVVVVEKTTLDDRLVAVLDEPLSKSLTKGDVEIEFFDLDGDGVAAELGFVSDGVQKPLSEAFEDTSFALFGGLLENLLADNVEEDAQGLTLMGVLSATLVGYIIMAIVFVVLLIVLSIVVALLMKLIKAFVTRTYLGHFIDKALGAVLGLVISAVFIWGVLAIIRILGTYDWIIPVNELIESSTLTKLLYDNNILHDFIVDAFDIKALLDSLLGGLSGTGNAPAVDEGTVEEALRAVSSVILP